MVYAQSYMYNVVAWIILEEAIWQISYLHYDKPLYTLKVT